MGAGGWNPGGGGPGGWNRNAPDISAEMAVLEEVITDEGKLSSIREQLEIDQKGREQARKTFGNNRRGPDGFGGR